MYGFSGTIPAAILSLYSSPSTRVWTSSILLDPFTLTNGSRQSCPLSPLIFALVVEPLAQTIRSILLISGINVGDTKHKISHYAEVTISLSNLLNSLALQCTFDHLNAISLYIINYTKICMLDTVSALIVIVSYTRASKSILLI